MTRRSIEVPELLTVSEAMQTLRLSRWKVYDLIRSGELTTVTIGRRRLVPREALTDYVHQLMQETE